MTNAEIIQSIRLEGYSEDLTDAEIVAAIGRALLDLRYEYPLIVGGTFTLVADQQVYDLFRGPYQSATQKGVFDGGWRLYELIGAGSGAGSPNDVFGIAPLLQSGALSLGSTAGNSFYTPGDWVIWDQNWSAFSQRFSTLSFEHIENRPASPVRVFQGSGEVCGGSGTVMGIYSRPRTQDQIQNEDEAWFLLFVEAYCCRTLANKFSYCAGVQIGSFVQDTGKTVQYWDKMAQRKQAEAWMLFEKRKFDYFSGAMRFGTG